MPQPNLNSPSNVVGKNNAMAVTTVRTAITTNSNNDAILHSESLTVCNTSQSAVTVTVDFDTGVQDAAPVELCVISIPAQSMLEVINKNTPKKLLPLQSIRLTASADSALKAIHTYLEIT